GRSGYLHGRTARRLCYSSGRSILCRDHANEAAGWVRYADTNGRGFGCVASGRLFRLGARRRAGGGVEGEGADAGGDGLPGRGGREAGGGAQGGADGAAAAGRVQVAQGGEGAADQEGVRPRGPPGAA